MSQADRYFGLVMCIVYILILCSGASYHWGKPGLFLRTATRVFRQPFPRLNEKHMALFMLLLGGLGAILFGVTFFLTE